MRGLARTARGSIFALLGALALLAAVCWEPDPDAPRLRIGTAEDREPFFAGGRGFDVDVANAFARELGYRVEWVRLPRDPLQARDPLQVALGAQALDVAMGGLEWDPERDAAGWLTRAVALGGPCAIEARSEREPGVRRFGVSRADGVDRGEVGERWARQRFGAEPVQRVEGSRELLALLGAGRLDAVVADRFEIPGLLPALPPGGHFAVDCSGPRRRIVYWVAPARAADLGPALDGWLAAHEAELAALRERWWGERDSRGELEHLADLLGRRLAFMPWVAAAKRARSLPIEDLAQEARVLDAAQLAGSARGLDGVSLRELFRVQIELAKAVQAHALERAPGLDLDAQIRPALARLGERIADSLARLAPIDGELRPALEQSAGDTLDAAQIAALEAALRAVVPARADRRTQLGNRVEKDAP